MHIDHRFIVVQKSWGFYLLIQVIEYTSSDWRVEITKKKTVSDPTDTFIMLKPENSAIEDFFAIQKRRSADFGALKLRMRPSGREEAQSKPVL